MKQCREFVVKAFVGGLLVIVPVYLALLLLLRAMHSLMGLVRPFAMVFPDWFPAEDALALLLVLLVSFLIGVAVRTPAGRVARERIEKALFERIPGYALFRSLTQQLAGESRENVWKPALAEIEEALAPPHSSLKNLRTGVSPCSSRLCPRHSLEPSIFSAGTVCILWTFLSRRRSRPSRDGVQGPKFLSRP